MIDPTLLMPKKPKGQGMREIARMIIDGAPLKPKTVDERIFEALSPADQMLVEEEKRRGAPMWQTLDGSPPLPQDPPTPVRGNTEPLTRMMQDAKRLGRRDLEQKIDALMDAFPSGIDYQSLPPQAGQVFDSIADELGNALGASRLPIDRATPAMPQDPPTPAINGGNDPMQEDPRGMFWQEDSRFDDARAYQVADSGQIKTDAMTNEPPPSTEELAGMAQNVGIDPEALKGLELNATEARNFGYLLRMMEAEKVVRELQDSNTLGQRLLEMLPGRDIEGMLMDPDYRRYTLARENFNEAALRAATGATINQQEMPLQRQNYFPLPTDDEETRQLLQRQREALLMALTAGSGPAAAIIPQYGQAVVPSARRNTSEMSDEELLRALQGGE